MSRSKSKRSGPKYQKAKLACLPFLLAVLGYVLLPSSDSDDEKPAATRVASRKAAASSPGAAGRVENQQHGPAPAKLPAWSELASSRRGRCNPFLPIAKEEEEPAAPPQLLTQNQPPAAAAYSSEVADAGESHLEPGPEFAAPAVDVAKLSQQPVRYFFQANNRRVMLVGDRLLSEGQTLESYTVTRLEPNRIQLEPAADDTSSREVH